MTSSPEGEGDKPKDDKLWHDMTSLDIINDLVWPRGPMWKHQPDTDERISHWASWGEGGGGVAKKWRIMTRWLTINPKNDDVIYEQHAFFIFFPHPTALLASDAHGHPAHSVVSLCAATLWKYLKICILLWYLCLLNKECVNSELKAHLPPWLNFAIAEELALVDGEMRLVLFPEFVIRSLKLKSGWFGIVAWVLGKIMIAPVP